MCMFIRNINAKAFLQLICLCAFVPVSRTGGQVRKSTAAEASFDLSSLLMSCVVITHTDRLTCMIQYRQYIYTSCVIQQCGRMSITLNSSVKFSFLSDLQQTNRSSDLLHTVCQLAKKMNEACYPQFMFIHSFF